MKGRSLEITKMGCLIFRDEETEALKGKLAEVKMGCLSLIKSQISLVFPVGKATLYYLVTLQLLSLPHPQPLLKEQP